ncbi:MAG: peptidylprolyl isomerase [Bacteroidales bacterium]|nr:peptidylprolyl isomerase [Candidatus Physcousia equi]
MKKIMLASTVLLSALNLSAQSDPVVMKINGKNITRSEFEYNYNKNNSEDVLDKKDLKEYIDLFINYKLKVEAALDDHLDTLQSYQKEFRQYRDQQVRPMLIPKGAEEKEVRDYYTRMLESLEGHDLYLPAHIFIHLGQNASDADKTAGKAKIDSIYGELKVNQFANFEELARVHSDDRQTGQRGGVISWIGPHQVLPEMEKVVYSLKDSGDVSEPFLSTAGYHIVQLKGRKPLGSYEELKPKIQNYLQQTGLAERLAQQVVDSLVRTTGMTEEQVMEAETERLSKTDEGLKYLVQEYHDGLLLFEECTNRVWGPASKDTLGLQKFFKKNKKKYAWEKPHFRGMVIHCRRAADVAGVKALLQGVDENLWIQTVREKYNKDSVCVRMEQKIFAQGENAFCDSLAFNAPSGNARPRKDFPFSGVVGKVLPKGPEKWTDVSADVVADYQALREKEFVATLRKRYKFEVDKDVLKTVNNH